MTREGAPPDWITPVSLLKDDEGNYVDAPENATKGAFPTRSNQGASQDRTSSTLAIRFGVSQAFEEKNKVNQYAYLLKPGWDAQVFANEASVQGIRLYDRLNNAERTAVAKEFSTMWPRPPRPCCSALKLSLAASRNVLRS